MNLDKIFLRLRYILFIKSQGTIKDKSLYFAKDPNNQDISTHHQIVTFLGLNGHSNVSKNKWLTFLT